MRFRTAAVLCMAAGLVAPVQAKDRADLRGKWQYNVTTLKAFDVPKRPEDRGNKPQDDGTWFIPVWPAIKRDPTGERRQGFKTRGEDGMWHGVVPDGLVEFGDGTIATRVGTEAGDTFDYKVVKSDQDIVWLAVTSRDKPGASPVTMIAGFKDADTIQLWPEADPTASLALKRVKAAVK